MKKICVFLYFLCKNHIYSNFENNKVNIYIYILLLTLCDQGSNQWNKCESPLLDRTTNSIASHDPQQHQHIHWLRANKDHQSSCPRTLYLSHHGLILESLAVHETHINNFSTICVVIIYIKKSSPDEKMFD